MATITVSRQMGCLGSDIAGLVADMLGYRLAYRDIINQAAMRAGAPEAALAAIDELGLLGICPSPAACLAYRKAVEQVMKELADQDNVVIIGRAGQIILGGRPGVLHVRLIAPQQLRAERIAQRHNISIEGAQAQIQASDRYRRNYLRRFYNVHWDNPELYHLVINTGWISPKEAALVICQAAKNLQQPNNLKNLITQETKFEHPHPPS